MLMFIGSRRKLRVRTPDSPREVPSSGTDRYGPSDPWGCHSRIRFKRYQSPGAPSLLAPHLRFVSRNDRTTLTAQLDPEHLIAAILQPTFIAYTAINLFFLTVLILLSRSHTFGNRYIWIDVGVCTLFGGYTVLSTKALSSLLSVMFLSAFEWWVTWLLVAVLIGTSVMQIKYLNKALMRFQSKVSAGVSARFSILRSDLDLC